MFDRLADPDLYLASAERVRSRQLRAGDARPLLPRGPQLRGLADDLPALATAVAREVRAGRYVFGPVTCRMVFAGGKQRALYVPSPLDDIVLGGVAQALTELVEPSLSPRVFSYRRGRSPWLAIAEFRGFLNAHRRALPKLARGLYVVRRDIRGYGDAIPAGEGSALYLQLAAALRDAGVQPTAALLTWLRSAFRPALQLSDGAVSQPERGVPTGSPLQPLACNLYLREVDSLCEADLDGFYARYGDDIVFAHPSAERAQRAALEIDATLVRLGLEPNPSKSAALYFTAAGRPSPAPGFRPSSACEYLGVRIDFRGSVGLKRAKLRSLLDDVRRRLGNSARLLRRVPAPQRTAALASLLSAALDPAQPLAHPSAHALRGIVDDRGQLRDLDYKLARLLAQRLAGDRTVRALRRYPPRRLRALGLTSLERARNGAGRSSA